MKYLFSKLFFPITFSIRFLRDKLYDLSVFIHSKRKPRKIRDGKTINLIKNYVFYFGLMAIPLAFAIMTHIIVNGGSFVLAFQKTEGGVTSFAGFANFERVFRNMVSPEYKLYFGKSFILYFVSLFMNVPSTILAYYIYKKFWGHAIFKVILYIPKILSGIITVTIYKIFCNEVIPEVWNIITGQKIDPLLSNPSTAFGTLLFYSEFMSLGGGLLGQVAAMNGVDVSVTEAAQLDGIGFYQEFWYIVLPASYTVLAIGIICSAQTIFGATLGLYGFYGLGAPKNVKTIGYFIEVLTIEAEFDGYHYLSAWGLVATAIIVPITLTLKHLVYKYGPSED